MSEDGVEFVLGQRLEQAGRHHDGRALSVADREAVRLLGIYDRDCRFRNAGGERESADPFGETVGVVPVAVDGSRVDRGEHAAVAVAGLCEYQQEGCEDECASDGRERCRELRYHLWTRTETDVYDRQDGVESQGEGGEEDDVDEDDCGERASQPYPEGRLRIY